MYNVSIFFLDTNINIESRVRFLFCFYSSAMLRDGVNTRSQGVDKAVGDGRSYPSVLCTSGLNIRWLQGPVEAHVELINFSV